MDNINIMYLDSFSRSGETLLLRILDAHPDIHVLHQLYKKSDEGEELYDLFRYIKNNVPNIIDSENKILKKIKLHGANTLLVKNSNWDNNNVHNGFILIRNPFSIYLSYISMAERINIRKQMTNWARNIDNLLLGIVKSEDALTSLCCLYNKKMSMHYTSGMPILHYERFVASPENTLKPLIEKLGFTWDPDILNSHLNYNQGQYGHGGMPLWKGINDATVHSYLALDRVTFSKIYGICYPVLNMYGYDLDENGRLYVKDSFDCRV